MPEEDWLMDFYVMPTWLLLAAGLLVVGVVIAAVVVIAAIARGNRR